MKRLIGRLFGRGEPVSAALARAAARAAAGDHAAAVAIWEPLARKGNARARNALGACYAEGLGVARDPALARRWIERAAAAGDLVAQRNPQRSSSAAKASSRTTRRPRGSTRSRPRTATRRRRTC